jgi:hypothetical protein
MNAPTRTFKTRVRELMRESGMDFDDMAVAVERIRQKKKSNARYTVEALNNIFKRHDKPFSTPPLYIIEQYAEALGVTPGQLTGDE